MHTRKWSGFVLPMAGLLALSLIALCSKANAQVLPSLSETTSWLQSALPDSHRFANDYDNEESLFDYRFDGCTWMIRRGAWSLKPIVKGLTALPLYSVRFESRIDQPFLKRHMNAKESREFAHQYQRSSEPFFAEFEVIDFSKIRLSSFKIEEGPEFGATVYVGLSSPKYAFVSAADLETARRFANALQHAASLCGAKDERF